MMDVIKGPFKIDLISKRLALGERVAAFSTTKKHRRGKKNAENACKNKK